MLTALLAATVLTTAASPSGAPVVEAAPNLYGQTGVLRTTSAETGKSGTVDVGADGFFFIENDFLIPKSTDVFTGGNLTLSTTFFDLVELSLASRAASNANSARTPSQFSVGDLYPSLKLGYAFGPVALGLDVRGLLPTRVDRAGFDLGNWAVTTQGLVTLDLHRSLDIPLRVHLDGGYVVQGGKYQDVKTFEQNPNFYDGVDGQLLALASDQWFYDQVVAGLAVEVPLPYATPFVEAWYQAAVGVPGNRGVGGKAYDFTQDAHLTVTPGARLTLGGGFTLDAAVDIGILGTGNGGDLKHLVDGTPANPTFAVRGGLTYTFDPFGGSSSSSSSSSSSAGPTGQVKGCVTDDGGTPVAAAVVTSPALDGARLASDEAGCFLTPPLPTGDVQLTVEKDGYEKVVLAASVDAGRVSEASAKLKRSEGAAALPSAAPGGVARIVGWVTNKDDETLDAELELWDATGVKPAGKALGGAFDLQAVAGRVAVVAKADGYLALGASVVVPPGGRGRANIVLKKAPRAKKAVIQKDKIAITGKVPFEFKKPRLQSTAVYVLDDVVDVLLRNPKLKVRIDVYAESLATPEESQKLADERASAVADWLASHGVWPGRLSTKGVPLKPTDPDRLRHVDFVIVP